MSTLLVTLTVVGLAIAGAMAVAIMDPNQPATLRVHRTRAPRPSRSRRARTPSTIRQPATTRVVAVPARQDASGSNFTEQWSITTGTTSIWLRLRSGVVLTVLLAVVGALIAMSIAVVVVLLALAVRSAVS